MNYRSFQLRLLSVILVLSPSLYGKHPESIDEALKCMFYIRVTLEDGVADGSGFVVEEDGKQWICTNAHVIDGAKKISIRDYQGAAVKGIGEFQCYSLESGSVQLNGQVIGADGVRFELKKKRDLAFELPKEHPVLVVDDPVTTIGDNRGKKRMDVLEGVVSEVVDGYLATTCETKPGASGGVVLLADGLIPVGLHTHGIPVPANPLQGLWDLEKGEDEKLAGASELYGVKWISMPLRTFLNAKAEAAKLKKAVMVLTLVYKLAPDESGFVYFVNDEIVPGVKMGAALELLKDDPIVAPIFRMNQKLNGRGTGNIGVNNMELARLFFEAISASRKQYSVIMTRVKKNYPPYHQINDKTTGVHKVGRWTDGNLEKAESWFLDKIRLGGKLPVGRWYAKYTFEELVWK